MKLPNIVLTPMEESPTMLETWVRLKHLGQVRVSTVLADRRELYRTTLEFLDGRILGAQSEDLYGTFLQIYRRVVRESEINEARNNRLRGSNANGVIYDDFEKVWKQSDARIHQRMVRRDEMEDINTTYQPEVTIGTFVTANVSSAECKGWNCQGWVICLTPLRLISIGGDIYECGGKGVVVTTPPYSIPEGVQAELDRARGLRKRSESRQDIW